MKYTQNNEIYLDLFDDEFYSLSEFSGSSAPERKITNIRLHFLLWIIMGKTVVVPEQWALSSRLCQHVINEIYASFSDFLRNTKKTGMHYPIRIQAISRPSYAGDDRNDLEKALVERLESNRRIQIDKSISQEDENDDVNLKSAIADCIKNLEGNKLEKDLKEKDYQSHKDRIYDKISSSTKSSANGGSLSQEATDCLASVLSYNRIIQASNRFELKSRPKHVSFETYRPAIANEVNHVHNTVHSKKYIDSNDVRLEALKEMFAEAERLNLPKEAIMEMQDLIRGYPISSQIFIQRLGRMCMHGAISQQYGVAYGTNGMAGSLDDYFYDEFEAEFQDTVRDRKIISEFSSQGHSIDGATEIPRILSKPNKISNQYFNSSKIDWDVIWAELFEFLYNSDWSEKREKIVKNLVLAIDQDPANFNEEAEKLIASICNEFSIIHAEKVIKGGSFFSFTTKALVDAKDEIARQSDIDILSPTGQISFVMNMASYAPLIYLGSKFAREDLSYIGSLHFPLLEKRLGFGDDFEAQQSATFAGTMLGP